MTIKSLLVLESFITLTTFELKDLFMSIKMLLQEDSSSSLQTAVVTLVVLNPVVLKPHMPFHAVPCGELDLSSVSLELSLVFLISHGGLLTKTLGHFS